MTHIADNISSTDTSWVDRNTGEFGLSRRVDRNTRASRVDRNTTTSKVDRNTREFRFSRRVGTDTGWVATDIGWIDRNTREFLSSSRVGLRGEAAEGVQLQPALDGLPVSTDAGRGVYGGVLQIRIFITRQKEFYKLKCKP